MAHGQTLRTINQYYLRNGLGFLCQKSGLQAVRLKLQFLRGVFFRQSRQTAYLWHDDKFLLMRSVLRFLLSQQIAQKRLQQERHQDYLRLQQLRQLSPQQLLPQGFLLRHQNEFQLHLHSSLYPLLEFHQYYALCHHFSISQQYLATKSCRHRLPIKPKLSYLHLDNLFLHG